MTSPGASANDSLPLVSVIILSYRRPDCLRQALQSFAAQTYPRIECIVVDNPSDRSEEVESVTKEAGVRLVRCEANLGYTGGMNRGIAAASGHYVHLTVDDVTTSSDAIASLVEYAEAHPAPGILTGIAYEGRDTVICCAGGEFNLATLAPLRFHHCAERDTGQVKTGLTGFVLGSMVFCRLDYLRWLGGYREDFFMYVEDVEMSARVMELGHTITLLPQFKTWAAEPSGNPREPMPGWLRVHSIKNTLALYTLYAPAAVLPRFYAREIPISLLRDALKVRQNFWPRVRAVGWIAWHLPALWLERRRRKLKVAEVKCRGWQVVSAETERG